MSTTSDDSTTMAYPCPIEGCKIQCTRPSGLAEHMRSTHHSVDLDNAWNANGKWKRCDGCNLIFNGTQGLSTHKRRCNGQFVPRNARPPPTRKPQRTGPVARAGSSNTSSQRSNSTKDSTIGNSDINTSSLLPPDEGQEAEDFYTQRNDSGGPSLSQIRTFVARNNAHNAPDYKRK